MFALWTIDRYPFGGVQESTAYRVAVATDAPEPIACTLDASAAPQRIADWGELLTRAVRRTTAPDGAVRIEFGDHDLAGEIARLAVAEQQCCSFFSFAITVDSRGLALEVRAPAEAADLIGALFPA